MQSWPFGSSSEYTKQLKASLNCSPQTPCAMPPKHGQSQLISPVSGLNAAWLASPSPSKSDMLSSVSASEPGSDVEEVGEAGSDTDAGSSREGSGVVAPVAETEGDELSDAELAALLLPLFAFLLVFEATFEETVSAASSAFFETALTALPAALFTEAVLLFPGEPAPARLAD